MYLTTAPQIDIEQQKKTGYNRLDGCGSRVCYLKFQVEYSPRNNVFLLDFLATARFRKPQPALSLCM